MDVLDDISDDEWIKLLGSCCVSENWIQQMLESRPFEDEEILFERAETIWFELDEKDWLEAFEGHPQIGDVKTLKEKYQHTADSAALEQSNVEQATDETLQELADLNGQYLKKFGFIFIVFASGKSAQEMLQLLKNRMGNDRITELQNAAIEQNKITKLRLEKLL